MQWECSVSVSIRRQFNTELPKRGRDYVAHGREQIRGVTITFEGQQYLRRFIPALIEYAGASGEIRKWGFRANRRNRYSGEIEPVLDSFMEELKTVGGETRLCLQGRNLEIVVRFENLILDDTDAGGALVVSRSSQECDRELCLSMVEVARSCFDHDPTNHVRVLLFPSPAWTKVDHWWLRERVYSIAGGEVCASVWNQFIPKRVLDKAGRIAVRNAPWHSVEDMPDGGLKVMAWEDPCISDEDALLRQIKTIQAYLETHIEWRKKIR